MKVRQ